MLKNILIALVLLASTTASLAAQAQGTCHQPMMFFDLGQTLVDTDTNKYNPMFYYRLDAREHSDARDFPTAKEYLDTLVARGHKLGLLADIPGDWGVNYPANAPILDLPSAKAVRTMDFLAGVIPEDGASWTGTQFDWAPFVKIEGEGAARRAVGRLLLPQTNAERKGKGSGVLFERAMAIANAESCPAVFQGEQEGEMILAEKAGMIPYWVGHTQPGQFYLSPAEVNSYVKNFKPGAWRPSAPSEK